MPILWWIWIHNIQERCLLGKDFSLLKAPSFTPSESINISKGRIILIIDNIQYVSMSKLKTSFRCRVPRTGYGGVAAVWWTRGVVLVGAIFFFTGCFIGACSRAAPLLRSPLAGTWTWSHRPSRCWPRASSGNTNTAPCPWPTTPAWLLYLCLLHSKPT